MNVAILGCGKMGRTIIENIWDSPYLDEIIGYDVSEAALKTTCEKFNIRVTTRLEEILLDDTIRLVYIAASNSAHVPLAIAAMKAGKAVMTEKPIGLTPEELDRLLAAQKETGAFIQVGLELRYSRLYRKAKEVIDSGRIGRPVSYHYTYSCSPYEAENWRVRKINSGSMYHEKLCHYIDLVRWWNGSRVSEFVVTSAPNTIPYFEIEDNVHVSYRFENGAVSHLFFLMTAAPTGIVAEAVNRYSNAKIAGLCAGGFNGRNWTAMGLDVDKDSVRYDLIGLNHLNFAYNITVKNKKLTPEQFRKVVVYRGEQDADLCVAIGALPSSYLQYYFHTSRRVKELQEKEFCRAEEVLRVEKEVYADYADPQCETKPASIQKRGGGGYSEIALGLISAVYNDKDTWITVNVPNRGTVSWLPEDAVIETACIANAAGIRPIQMEPAPRAIRGLIAAVKNYEQLAVEAAVTGSVETAELALLAHPLVGDWEIVKQMLPKLLEANRQWLKNFRI